MELGRRPVMLLLLFSRVDPVNPRSSPLTGAVPPQLATLVQVLLAPRPLHVSVAARAPKTKPKFTTNKIKGTRRFLNWDRFAATGRTSDVSIVGWVGGLVFIIGGCDSNEARSFFCGI